MLEYPKSEEAKVSWDIVQTMKDDPELIVVYAIQDHESEEYIVCFWRKERGVLPPWIKIAA